eukprot:4758766-Lingulodinium_polyedra.AAC.1
MAAQFSSASAAMSRSRPEAVAPANTSLTPIFTSSLRKAQPQGQNGGPHGGTNSGSLGLAERR